MNDFDEDKWSAEQRLLDGRIALEFDGLEGSRATYEATGGPLAAWLAAQAAQVAALRTAVAGIDHAGRRQHWEREIQRLGFAPSAAEVAAVKAADRANAAHESAIERAALRLEQDAADAADDRQRRRKGGATHG